MNKKKRKREREKERDKAKGITAKFGETLRVHVFDFVLAQMGGIYNSRTQYL